MNKGRLLIIEDDEDIIELLKYNLAQERYKIHVASSGEAGLNRVRQNRPDLILLDLMLPGLDGLEVCKELKGNPRTKDVPIIMLTAKGEESDIIIGLELGADDYVTKPFSPKVLIARIRSVLRRKKHPETDDSSIITRDELTIDPTRHEVRFKDRRIDLTATEFGLLRFLALRPGWVFTRQQIVDAVKGEDYAVTERAVDVQMVGLRKKLEEAADYVETVRGIGYRFKD